MYLITKPPGKSTSRNYPRLLAKTLGEESAVVRVGKLELAAAFSAGDPDWHSHIVAPPAVLEPAIKAKRLDPATVRKSHRLPSLRPSEQKTGVVGVAQMFTLGGAGRAAADFGITVHALLAGVEWWAGSEADLFTAAWPSNGAAGEEALACLLAPELASVWARPTGAGRAEVWREREFEIILDGNWVTGVFDRVVIERSANGRAIWATVYDFKTDRVAGAGDLETVAARYRAQLNLYRRAAAVLANLSDELAACELVLTKLRRRVVISRG